MVRDLIGGIAGGFADFLGYLEQRNRPILIRQTAQPPPLVSGREWGAVLNRQLVQREVIDGIGQCLAQL